MRASGSIAARYFRALAALTGVACAVLVLFHGRTALAAAIVEIPRSEAPMGNFTALFSKRQFVTGDGIHKRTQTYYWLGPQSAGTAGTKFPLVVVLHDARGKAYAAEVLASQAMRNKFPAYVLVPQSPDGKDWAMPESYSDTPAYRYEPQRESLPDVITMLPKVPDENSIDRNRVYIVGCGDGGAGVYGALLRFPSLFAGGVAINAKWSVQDAADLIDVPLLIEHGAADDVVPAEIARLMSNQIGENGGSVSYQEFPGIGHACAAPDFYSPDMWDALFRQKKSD
jgi:predicted peptidase